MSIEALRRKASEQRRADAGTAIHRIIDETDGVITHDPDMYPRLMDRLADPIIRAQVLSELAEYAEEYHGYITWRFENDKHSPTDQTIADWLRAQGGGQW